MKLAKVPPDIAEYQENLRRYNVRLCEWLGLDPSKVFLIVDADVKPVGRVDPFGPPPSTDVTWGAIDKQEADERRGRQPLPWQVRGDVDGEVFGGGVHLDWQETERLRAEVGDRPEFPAPEGGWPTHWPQP